VDNPEDSKRAQIGRAVFKQFNNTVVILDKQKRVTDKKMDKHTEQATGWAM